MAVIALQDAQQRILADIEPMDTVEVSLENAHGLVLHNAVRAREDIPPFATTAMDGFAVRAADVVGASAQQPVALRVIGTLAAGHASDLSVGVGEAMRIMTGAPMPDGADAVVMVESTTLAPKAAEATDGGAEIVLIAEQVEPGTHIRLAGEDVIGGTVVAEVGTELTAAHIGVLAGVGADVVTVRARPRVGVFSTGDELIDGPVELMPGQIRDSNRPMLLSLLRDVGAIAVDLGRLPDDEAAIERALNEATTKVDVILTSGGVSMGDYDYVKAVLNRLGEMNWMQIAIRPAKPLAFGVMGGVPVFGLPGNPVSSAVSFELFVRPALRAMMGFRNLDRRRLWALTDEPMRRQRDGKTHFQRVLLWPSSDGSWKVKSAGGQGSHQLSALAAANALAVLPDGEGVGRNQRVSVIPLQFDPPAL